MKYGHIERLNVTLTALSPVFIGGGDDISLNKKNTVSLPGKPYLLIPNQSRLIAYLDEHNLLDEYEAFIGPLGAGSLHDFLTGHGIPADESAEWVAYALECHEPKINTLRTFIKQADGSPYIPGSSVKGAFRTAMLAGRMTDTGAASLLQSADTQPRKRFPGEEENALRTLGLDWKNPGNAVNDLMKGISVSDSAPLKHNSLTVTQKQDYNSGKNSYDPGRMPLFRECLKPDTKARFTVSLDTGIFPLRVFDELKNALTDWDKALQQRYFNQFDIRTDDRPLAVGEYPVTLGAGTGFQSKTLLYASKDAWEVRRVSHWVLKSQFGKTYKIDGSSDLPAPYCMKLTEYKGGYYPYGRCALRFED